MKPRTIVLIILALVCGVSAAVGVSQMNQRDQPKADAETLTVITAAKDVPRGSVLTEKDLAVRQWPKSLVPAGAVSKIEEVIDRAVVVPLVQGEVLMEAKLATKEAGRGLAAMIEMGMRAFTIRTPHIAAGVGGFIKPGNRVDVLLNTRSTGSNDPTGGGATTTLLQNVKVLAVDQWLDDAPEENDRKPHDFKSVTLLVSPDQAAKLDLGMNMGTLHLSLRNPEDVHDADARPATMAELRFHQEQPLPAGPSALSKIVDVLAGALAKRKGPAETLSEVQAPAARRQTAYIHTLRGSHRGGVRIEGTW